MAKIREDDIDRLREKADIVEIISAYTQLKRSGGSTFKGQCPFHSDKTPSFTVDVAKALYHCLAGDTGVMTWEGTIPIAKLVGDTHRLLTTNGVWVDAPIQSFGNQRLWEIKLTRNRRKKTIFATDGHRWFVRSGKSHRSSKEKVTATLREGDRLLSAFPNSGNLLSTVPSPFGIAQGFTFGDGSRTKYSSVATFDGNKDSELIKFFPASEVWTAGGRIRVGKLPLFFKDLPPLSEAPSYLYGWLAGYFAADGCVAQDGQVILSSASKENLEFVRTLANRLGIGTYGIKHQSRAGFPGRAKSALFHLTFISSTLRPEFFVLSKHRLRFEAIGTGRGHERKQWVVQSVQATDRVEEVFCAVVSETHAFVLEDNILTGNCFGCGEGGNIYQFVQKKENLPFPDAVEWVARRSGFDLHYEEMRPGEAQARGVKARLHEANGLAAEFFHSKLIDLSEAAEARGYLDSRGFGKEVAQRWKLGYAPGRDALTKYLMSKGYTAEELISADLSRRSDRDGSLYDSFRQRITFPTWNLQGEVVAFGARAMGDAQPKYLNTSETPVFSKSRVMYGLNLAKSAIARGAAAIVVEGYTDVIAMHEAGLKETVATNGVALGETHFELLKKFTSRAVLMFDADDAGKGATERGFGLHHRIGLEVLVAPLEPGRDPAEVVAAEGADAIRKIVETARPLIEFKLEETISKMTLDTPEARSRAVREAVSVLRWQPDPIARHEYAFQVAQRIGVDVEVVQRTLNESASEGPARAGREVPIERSIDRRFPGHVKVEREVLQLLLVGKSRGWASEIEAADLTSGVRREVFELASLPSVTDPGAIESLSPDALALFTELTVGVAPQQVAELDARAGELAIRLKVFRLEREIKSRRDTLQEINPLVDAQRHDELFTELVGLEATRRDLLRRIQGAA